MEPSKIEAYWALHEEMGQSGLLGIPDRKYCEYCGKVVTLPPKGESNDHFKWVPGSKSFRCKAYDIAKRKEGKVNFRNSLDGFLSYKYQTLVDRNNVYVKRGDQPILLIDKPLFIRWAKDTLPEFLEKEKIDDLFGPGVRIAVNRIDQGKWYAAGNLVWTNEVGSK